MTTPSERMRALRWGAQLLETILADPVVPSELRHRAAKLGQRYPDSARLLGLLADRSSWFPQGVAQDLFEAGLLFESISLSGQLSSASKHLLRCTIRHYPMRANGWHRPEDFELFHVDEVLFNEEDVDSRD